ncbi:pseudouridine synthase [Kiloniella sp.]|uniref:pseudouridine synthase n=1 Tax=Kiloniella sp. TaxID=1938587 RepID=UPI003B024106
MTNAKTPRPNRPKSGPNAKGRPSKSAGNRPVKGKPSSTKDEQPTYQRVEAAPVSDKKERIAKVIARAGLCSRRDAERWIAEGRVILDGKVLESPAIVVGPENSILVDGEPLPQAERARLWKYHKPKGQITAARDPEGRPTVFDKLPKDLPRLQPVGRLDYNSEGLLLFTNDGEVKRKMELPATGWTRRYRVRVHGTVEEHHIKALAEGMTIDGIHYAPIEAIISNQARTNAWMTMSLKEGKNREIRRVCEHLGLIVNRLIRISYGPFQLGEIPEGEIVELPYKLVRDQLGLPKEAPVEASVKTGKDGKPLKSGKPGPGRKKIAGKGKPETRKPAKPMPLNKRS